jgi:hypothetical protein
LAAAGAQNVRKRDVPISIVLVSNHVLHRQASMLRFAGMLESRMAGHGLEVSRINHLVTMAAIVRDTPARLPFIHGDSYRPLLTKWIPRALWPGKPEERLGNGWAQRYGFLGEHDSGTSYNLPWEPEMFMNFGWPGVVGISFLLGVGYRLLWRRCMAQPETAIQYAIGLTLAQTLVFTESNFSLQVGTVVILGILLWISNWAFGHFFPTVAVRPLPRRGNRTS